RGRGRRTTLVGNVQEFGSGAEPHPLEGELVDTADAGRGDRQFAGLRLGVLDHVGDALVGGPAIGCEYSWRVAQHGDRYEVGVDVVRHLLEQHRIDGEVTGGRDQQGVAVGCRAGDRGDADETVGARSVLDHDLLAQG